MTEQPERYSDQQGEQPEVSVDQLPSFAAFIEGHDDGEQALDMNGVTGISCATVHPKIYKAVGEMNTVAAKLHVGPDDFLSRLQSQISKCLGGDIVRAFTNEYGAGNLEVTPEALLAIVEYAMQQMILVYTALAPDFDDDGALVIARKMAEWIETTHKNNLPFFWKEVKDTLKGYENMDMGEIDDLADNQ